MAIPTETFYGLAVDPANEAAVSKLFELKRRPETKPVLVLIANITQLTPLVESTPDLYQELMTEFWPGPLTLVFPARDTVSSLLTAGTGTIGIRHSPHPVALELIELLGAPITATSANLSGRPSAVSAQEVTKMFGGQLDLVLDGGTSEGQLPSTVVRVVEGRCCVEREGVVDLAGRIPLCSSPMLKP